jgi:DNA polymerase-3 subunit beta
MTTPHFTVDRTALARELSLAIGAVERKTTIPILGNVKLEAVNGDRPPQLRIHTTDLELAFESMCLAEVRGSGSITLPAKRLLEYIAALPDGPVEMKIGANQWASITSGRAKSRIAGMSSESFPVHTEAPPATLTIPAAAFARLVKQTAYAVSQEESRFTLNGALLEATGSELRMVATDGHRLAMAEIPSNAAKSRLLVSRKALVEVTRLAGNAQGGAEVQISSDGNNVFFRIDERSLTARHLTGNFPDYQRVVPKTLTGSAVVERAALIGTINRVSGFADERSRAIKVGFKNGEISLAASSSEIGDSEESVPAEVTGPDVVAGFNAGYILDFLKSVGADKVTLRFENATTAITLEPNTEGGGTCRCVIMPMRI